MQSRVTSNATAPPAAANTLLSAGDKHTTHTHTHNHTHELTSSDVNDGKASRRRCPYTVVAVAVVVVVAVAAVAAVADVLTVADTCCCVGEGGWEGDEGVGLVADVESTGLDTALHPVEARA
jgi:hypothetical protein